MMTFMNDVNQPKKLVRTRGGRWVAGVCSGLGEYFGVDPNIVRLVFAVAAFIGFIGVWAYMVAWVVIPEEDEKISIAEKLVSKAQNGRRG